MASTFTSRLGFELQATGENSGIWGSNLNSNAIALIDTAIAGLTSVPLAGTDVTLTKQNGTIDESRSAILYLHGTLINDVAVVVPSVTKAYAVDNKTSGPFNVTVKTAGGTGTAVAQGTARTIYVTGTSVIPTSPGTSVGSPTFGSAAYANIGTSANELVPTSAADTRYSRNFGMVTLPYAATVTVDFATGYNFMVSAGGNFKLVPTGMNPARDQGGIIWVCQPPGGNAVITWDSQFKFPAGTSVVLTSTSGACDLLPYAVRTSAIVDVTGVKDMR
jgi:hypothetical protein